MRRGRLLLALALGLAPSAWGQLPDDVEVGAFVEVQGELRTGGGVVAEEVEVQAVADALDRVRGPVETLAPRERLLRVAGVPLRVAEGARLTDAAGGPLALETLRSGHHVDVRGAYAAGEFLVHALSVTRDPGPAGRVKLEGRIDAVDAEADAFRLLGVGVLVTQDTWVELD